MNALFHECWRGRPRFEDDMLGEDPPGSDLADMIVNEPLMPTPGGGAPFRDIRFEEERQDVLCCNSLVNAEFAYGCRPAASGAPRRFDATAEDVIMKLVIVSSGTAFLVARGASCVDGFAAGLTNGLVRTWPDSMGPSVGDAFRVDLSTTCSPIYAANAQSRACESDLARSRRLVATVKIIAAPAELNRVLRT